MMILLAALAVSLFTLPRVLSRISTGAIADIVGAPTQRGAASVELQELIEASLGSSASLNPGGADDVTPQGAAGHAGTIQIRWKDDRR